MNYQDILKKSHYIRKQIQVDTSNSFNNMKNNEVIESLDLITKLKDVTHSGVGEFSKENLTIHTSTKVENIVPRPSIKFTFKFDNLDLSNYNYMNVDILITSTGYESFYVHFVTGNDDELRNHAPIVYPNYVNHISWDISDLKKDRVNNLIITPYLMGTPDEALDKICVKILKINAEKRHLVKTYGWQIDENLISYSHSGYMINDEKIALVGKTTDKTFKICDNNSVILNKDIKYITKDGITFGILNFSEIKKEGIYHIETPSKKSKDFMISNDCYTSSIVKSINFLRLLNCGKHIDGVRGACHLNCRAHHPTKPLTVPTFGGWHDAGDQSQFEICTAEIATSLLNISKVIKDEQLSFRIKEEAKVGLDWLTQTSFNDGYRALKVLYRYHRSSILEDDNKEVYKDEAEEGCFENFLSSISYSTACLTLNKEDDPIYYDYLLRLAKEDLEFAIYEYDNNIYTKRWGSIIDSVTLGAALITLTNIYTLTKDKKYLEYIYKYANIVMSCQEKDTNKKIYGYFYERKDQKHILIHEHRAHEEYVTRGLKQVYDLNLDKTLNDAIFETLSLYKDYIINTIDYIYPFKLLPGGIYDINKINLERITYSKEEEKEVIEFLNKEIKNGIKIDNNTYLRRLPIAYSRKGFLATNLSKTKAVSCIMKMFDDETNKKLFNIVTSQIKWTLGFNPFSSSLMWAEGYNYHDLYVAFSRQMVGALPVGIMTYKNLDIPYWPDYTDAVFKEVWGHTTSKYLEVLKDILED